MASEVKEIDAIEEARKAQAEHGQFDDTSRRRRGPRGARLMVIVLSVIAGAGAIGFLALSVHNMNQREQAKKVQQQSREKLVETADTDWRPEAPSPAETVAAPAAPATVATPPKPATVPELTADVGSVASATPAPLSAAQLATNRRLASGFSSSESEKEPDDEKGAEGSSGKPDPGQALVDAIKAQQSPGSLGGGDDAPAKQSNGGGLEDKLQPLKLQASKAGYVGARDFLILRGTTIDCGLRGNLDTTVPGMVSCITTRAVWSDNMRVVLIDAGSKVTGFVQSAPTQGQARVFVTWQRIQTPQGVIIDVDSPATDGTGAAGIPGKVNNHWWARLGGGLSISLVSDLGQAVANSQNNGSSTVNLTTTSNTSDTLISEVLKNSINIAPTLTANRAQRVTIAVIRDLDFSGVYELEH